MAHRNQVVVGAVVGAASLAAGLGYVLGSMQSPVMDAAGPRRNAPAASVDVTRLEAELRAKDERIEELTLTQRRLEERVSELATPREPAPVARAAEPEPTRGPESTPPAPTDPRFGDVSSWLRTVLPDRYGELSPEELAALASLDLRGAQLTDADLALLASLPELKDLSLRGASITDAGMLHLRSLTQLEALELRGTPLTGAALRDLPTWNLQRLHLTDTQVAGEDLFGMPPMASLATLKLNRLAFGDEHVEALARYPSVSHLELDGTAITDAGLERLLALNPGLTRIELRGTKITSGKAQELVALYPDCELVLDSNRPGVLYR